MYDTLQDHETRIKKLEDSFTTLMTKMSTIENTQLTTQTILLTNKQDQDKLLHQIISQNGDIVTHTLDIKKEGKIGFWKVAGLVVGSGGILSLVIAGIFAIVNQLITIGG